MNTFYPERKHKSRHQWKVHLVRYVSGHIQFELIQKHKIRMSDGLDESHEDHNYSYKNDQDVNKSDVSSIKL